MLEGAWFIGGRAIVFLSLLEDWAEVRWVYIYDRTASCNDTTTIDTEEAHRY